MDARGLSEGNVVASAERSTMSELASLTGSAKKVLVF
jgi:sulfur relay (sulfurtransferase) complex TusBCD TusD component (DsrE family)